MGRQQASALSSRKRKKRGAVAQALLGLLLGAVGGIFIVSKLITDEITIGRLLLILMCTLIGIFISINIHELGHLFFGRMVGYKLISFRVSIFAWNNVNSEMKFSLMKNKGYGGLCAMIPPDKDLTSFQHGLFYAGGIIANILTGFLFLIASALFSDLPGAATILFFVTGVMAIILALLNLIPFVSANNPTDGKIIWSLLLKKPFAGKLMEVNRIAAQLAGGIRPKDIEISLSAETDNPQVIDLVPILYLYYKALDSNNLKDMLHYAGLLEDNLENFPDPILPGLYYELCHVGCISNDQEQATNYYHKTRKILQADRDVNGLRVKAYFEYYINKNPDSALQICERALAVADKFPSKGQGLMEADLVRALQNLIVSES